MSKDEIIKILTDKGFDVGYDNNGIPTVFVDSSYDISSAHKHVELAIKDAGYDQSYGISLSSKKNNEKTNGVVA